MPMNIQIKTWAQYEAIRSDLQSQYCGYVAQWGRLLLEGYYQDVTKRPADRGGSLPQTVASQLQPHWDQTGYRLGKEQLGGAFFSQT